MFGALAQFERRLIAERARGKVPGRPSIDGEKLEAALLLVRGGMSITKAAAATGLGRSTVYREAQGRLAAAQ